VALMRWRWVWGPIVAAALLAALLLPRPGESVSGGFFQLLAGGDGPSRNWTFRDDVQAALRLQHSRLRGMLLADSLSAVAAHGARVLRGRDPGVAVVYEAPTGPAEARVWLDAAEQELSRYPNGPSSGAPLVIALFSNPARARSTEFVNAWWTRRLMPDTLHAACIVEVNLVPSRFVARRVRPKPGRAFLGLCGLARRFGTPGPRVARWIMTGGLEVDYSDDPTWGGNWTTLLVEAGEAVPRREVAQPEFAWGQAGWQWYWGLSWVPIGCLHGTASLCERNAHIRGSAGMWWSSGDSRAAQVVARLLHAGGPAQFAAFWRSPLAVPDAMQRAYGRPAGELARDAFAHWYYAAPGGPRAEPRLLLGGLLWAGAAIVLALLAGRRWTTEV